MIAIKSNIHLYFKKCALSAIVYLIACVSLTYAQVVYPGIAPGAAIVKKEGSILSLENKVIKLSFKNTANKLSLAGFEDKQTRQQLALTSRPVFELTMANGSIVSSNDFTTTGNLVTKDLRITKGNSVEIAECKSITTDLENAKLGLKIHWEAVLGDNDNYIKQVFSFEAKDSIKINKITLIKLSASIAAKKIGTVDGSPLVYHNMFFAVEHPMSQVSENKGSAAIYLPRLEALNSGNPLTISSVFGVVPAGQLRRGFLYYVENERAHPYRQILHYNSWFDLSWVDRKLSDSVCLDRIKAFTDSLISKRAVKLDAFLFDDGWDDNKTLWQFNPGFPDGFANLSKATKAVKARLGVWISPWGGYDEPKEQRLAFGKKQSPPFETNENGFSLTGPVYYNRFRDVTLSFIKNYNVSMFKFDGVGAGNCAAGASITYQKDIEAFLKLITELRSNKPDLYLSLTVGTWPSVYWLKYGDAIWRAGDDTGLAGDGTKRQQWITYKDAQAYKNIVKRAPLFPLNSIMYHGICIADNGLPGKLEMDDKDVADEIWAFFGTGTGLQELYVNPHKLNSADWNCIRDAANWSKDNKKQLADIHWVGGDPAKGQIYGYAGWAEKKGVLTLRNPGSTPKSISISTTQIFEIPSDSDNTYTFYNARTQSHEKVYSGSTITVKLAPYEVKIMNATSM
ncbi:enterotoxin [Mucilaginibacter corticis]|uniref:Enterotoxin n=1 Tax=Mucilaginibacter corticis TaxID=2597670 RepID=A0A556MBU4_9SPHI|nr:enterotoxin [Mucilaginibacter corticis]TSJ37373.1 enterotoxin [Mucilaginibacter corticis]